ncbi:MAG: formylglycine-generating enzyme family protein [Chloroflexota bacterium]
MVWIEGNTFDMGSEDFYPEEGPVHSVTVEGFWIDKYAVTNAQFQRFVKATGYVTFAERPINPADYPGVAPEMLIPGSLVFQQPRGPVDLNDYRNWWAYIPGANWKHPEGPNSSLKGRRNHPVTQVAYEDATAYAKWAGKSLPTEAQWEYAARGGLAQAIYTWGNDPMVNGKAMANSWQGEFPWENLKEDGYERTAPVGSFPPNGFGLHDMCGNVWEWTDDWFQAKHPEPTQSPCCAPVNPRGGTPEESYDPAMPHIRIPRKVIKGGSYLCAPNYCLRYRPAARHAEMIDSSTTHIGFRCVSQAA